MFKYDEMDRERRSRMKGRERWYSESNQTWREMSKKKLEKETKSGATRENMKETNEK